MVRVAIIAIATAATLVAAQAPASSSTTDPLANVPTGTPHFTAATTYSIVSTYEQAGSVVPTTLVGNVGPSTFSSGFSFPYNRPVSSVPATYPSALMESLASAGLPTSGSEPLQVPLGNLQAVDDGAREMGAATGLAVVVALAAGAGIMFL